MLLTIKLFNGVTKAHSELDVKYFFWICFLYLCLLALLSKIRLDPTRYVLFKWPYFSLVIDQTSKSKIQKSAPLSAKTLILFLDQCQSGDKSRIMYVVQVNLCQKHLFSHQLTHNMTIIVYGFTMSVHESYKLRTFMYINCSECQNKKTIYVRIMFSPCSELKVFMY